MSNSNHPPNRGHYRGDAIRIRCLASQFVFAKGFNITYIRENREEVAGIKIFRCKSKK